MVDSLKIKDSIAKEALGEAIRMYLHWLSEANLSTDEEEQTAGYMEALEEVEKQLEK